jgi:protein-disulfide isomerase
MSDTQSHIWKYISLLLIGLLIGFLVGKLSPLALKIPTDDGPKTNNVTNEPERINVSVDDDPALGLDDVKVVIVEFSDYECPFCKKMSEEIIFSIKRSYVDTGKAKYVFRDFPLPVHKKAVPAAQAANCAGELGKYWEMHDMLYNKQSEWVKAEDPNALFNSYAQELRVNTTLFNDCLVSNKHIEEINKDKDDGVSYGVTSTPTLFINGMKIEGVPRNAEVIKNIIDAELENN